MYWLGISFLGFWLSVMAFLLKPLFSGEYTNLSGKELVKTADSPIRKQGVPGHRHSTRRTRYPNPSSRPPSFSIGTIPMARKRRRYTSAYSSISETQSLAECEDGQQQISDPLRFWGTRRTQIVPTPSSLSTGYQESDQSGLASWSSSSRTVTPHLSCPSITGSPPIAHQVTAEVHPHPQMSLLQVPQWTTGTRRHSLRVPKIHTTLLDYGHLRHITRSASEHGHSFREENWTKSDLSDSTYRKTHSCNLKTVVTQL